MNFMCYLMMGKAASDDEPTTTPITNWIQVCDCWNVVYLQTLLSWFVMLCYLLFMVYLSSCIRGVMIVLIFCVVHTAYMYPVRWCYLYHVFICVHWLMRKACGFTISPVAPKPYSDIMLWNPGHLIFWREGTIRVNVSEKRPKCLFEVDLLHFLDVW